LAESTYTFIAPDKSHLPNNSTYLFYL